MALRAFYEAENDVPAGMRDHYSRDEESGRYILRVDGAEGWAVEDVAGMKLTLGKLRQELGTTKKTLAGFQTLEKSPEDLRAALEDLVRTKEAAGDEPKQVAALKAQIAQLQTAARAELDKALGPVQSELEKRTKQVRELLVDARLTEAITAAKGRPKLLRPALERMVRVEADEAGELVAVVVDPEGTPRVAGKDLRPMSIRELVDEVRADPEWAAAFDSSGSSGGGTRPTTGGPAGSVTPEAVSRMSMSEYRKAREDGRIP